MSTKNNLFKTEKGEKIPNPNNCNKFYILNKKKSQLHFFTFLLF